MRHGLPQVKLHQVAQIGAGGAGAATAYAMLALGAEGLLVFDIDVPKAQELAEKLKARFPGREILATTQVAAAVKHSDGVVLATPVGTAAHPGMPFDPALLDSNMWIADVIYAPLETELLAQARRIGCRTINGSGMLSFQAAKAFQLFTGLEPDADRMLRSFGSHR
jgi:shikimate dehydrogenase